ncbi:MAG: S41 family peptidase [Deltaproteobacteria bacterium]|nr:S41 family peptidase [Deltaproteobacteria bacterium]
MKKTITVVFVLLLLGMPFVVHQANSSGQSLDPVYPKIRAIVEVTSIITRYYVQEVDMEKVVAAGIKGMMGALDPHSNYFSPQEAKNFAAEIKGVFGGIGTVISVRNGSLVVVAPLEDTPAYKKGIKAGDKITKIDGKTTEGFSVEDAVSKLRGAVGTNVTLEIEREGEVLKVEIQRATIHMKSLSHKLLANDIGYIRLMAFRDGVSADLHAALKTLKKSSKNGTMRGLILDLRNNPGGLITEGAEVADVFITEGILVYTEGRSPESNLIYRAKNDGDEPLAPLIVLVNEGSASASEIVAGALQDHERALLLGTRTFGKGSVQRKFDIYGGAAVKITTALYYTPKGRCIQAQGLEPDITVEAAPPKKGAAPPREKDIEGHLAKQNNGTDDNKPSSEAEETLQKDNQLRTAVDILSRREIIQRWQ